ncbi:MAG: hypothetical protein [Microviridae sp.]|nr:MAG: hypothetical protein [Microviridae sp.]
MGHNVTIGGERLGAGKKNKAYLRGYERSTHDLSYIWRSTMAAGTLVPFMTLVGLPGDTFDIDLNCDILTHPTIGPLFGTYKIQLDVFQIPVRLYQGKLHMNMLKIGLDMGKVPLPQINMFGNAIDKTQTLDNQQVNPSCIFSYLGIRGLGTNAEDQTQNVYRKFNAVPYLGYWDIYKNYYANKQEEAGVMIHKDLAAAAPTIVSATILDGIPTPVGLPVDPVLPPTYVNVQLVPSSTRMVIITTGLTQQTDPANFQIYILKSNGEDAGTPMIVKATDLFATWTIIPSTQNLIGENPIPLNGTYLQAVGGITYDGTIPVQPPLDASPQLSGFLLKNIDDMRQALLSHFEDTPYIIDTNTPAPYGNALQFQFAPSPDRFVFTKQYNQEGLGIKTYNSDLFNNWIQTEWIDGIDGITEITKIDTSGGSFTIDELNLSKKIYDMLNRIAISGGSYDDWLSATYDHDRIRTAENPMYLGGLIQNLVFQEVVSNSRSQDQPLGTLAGRGKIGNKKKGGKIVAKIDEPSYLMGIISLTPNIDYSQGNQWDVNLETMNDFHKPALDEIGFQDLITDQMAWYDTLIHVTGEEGQPSYRSAGKQPAWINYMTNVNKVLGNFAEQNQQMFMVLNRRYETKYVGVAPVDFPQIADLTTYIDPSKFNHIFADTRLDAQNFWAQIAVNIEGRRKMSAKVIPNL